MKLKEYLDRTRYDTGITTDEMEQGVKQITVDETMSILADNFKVGALRKFLKDNGWTYNDKSG